MSQHGGTEGRWIAAAVERHTRGGRRGRGAGGDDDGPKVKVINSETLTDENGEKCSWGCLALGDSVLLGSARGPGSSHARASLLKDLPGRKREWVRRGAGKDHVFHGP